MNKKLYFFFLISLLAAGCQKASVKPEPIPGPVACTQEAKQCPDGSYVARTGPNCDFAACPKVPPRATSTPPLPVPTPVQVGGVSGYVHMGPICPVQRIPADPACNDKPYANAEVAAVNLAGKRYTGQTNSLGKFSFFVPVGTYNVKIISTNAFPGCPEQQTDVTANKFVSLDIACDTGIR